MTATTITPKLSNLTRSTTGQGIENSSKWLKSELRNAKPLIIKISSRKNSGNPGELWRTLNEITSRKNVSPPSFIQSNGCQVTNPKLIACLLNDHFVTVGSKLSSKFQTVCSALGKILPSASKQNAQ